MKSILLGTNFESNLHGKIDVKVFRAGSFSKLIQMFHDFMANYYKFASIFAQKPVREMFTGGDVRFLQAFCIVLARLVETLVPFIQSDEVHQLFKVIEFGDLYTHCDEGITFDFEVSKRASNIVFFLQLKEELLPLSPPGSW